MLILDMPMPRACDDCPMLDESGDYPMCRITQETRGYSFNVREKRMDRCPIKGELTRCGECRYYDEKDHNCIDEMAYARCWMPIDFCSFGERCENDATD